MINSNLSGKANSSHTHDDRYYTELETDNRFNRLYAKWIESGDYNAIKIKNTNGSQLGIVFSFMIFGLSQYWSPVMVVISGRNYSNGQTDVDITCSEERVSKLIKPLVENNYVFIVLNAANYKLMIFSHFNYSYELCNKSFPS